MSDQQHNPCFDSEQLNKVLELSITKGKLSSALFKVEHLQQRIKELEQQVKTANEIVNAVAHIGIDFGYGRYELEDHYVHSARVYSEEQEKTNG